MNKLARFTTTTKAAPAAASHATAKCSRTVRAICLASIAFGIAAQGSEIAWSSKSGGNLADGANWSVGNVPGEGDFMSFSYGQSGPIWLSENLKATGGTSKIAAAMTLALTNATGEARSLTLYRLDYTRNPSVTARLEAGTLSLTSNFYMGNAVTAKDMNNTFVVDGDGTTFSGNEFRIGSNCSYSQFVVTNGATLTGTTLQVGYSTASNGLFRITGPGSTATFSSAVQFGSAGGNRMEVLDGACLVTTNLNVQRLEKYASSTVWDEACSLRVSGAGSRVVINGASGMGLYLGNTNGPNCSVEVEDGAVWESHGEFQIAADAATNTSFRVASGATFSHDTHGVFSGSAPSVGTLFAVDAATVTVASARGIEVRGTNATLAVSNGASVTTTQLKLGTGTGENDMLNLSGASSRVAVGATLELKSDGVLAVEIPAGGFTGGVAPISAKTLTLDAAAKMVVSIDPGMRDTGRIVLVEATNDITVPEGFVFELPDAASFPHGKVTLDRTNAKQIAVKVNCDLPTVISLR